MRTRAWVLLTLTALSGCASLQTSDAAIASALDAPLRRCAGALAGDDMPTARAQCLPVVAIYEAAIGGGK